MPNPNTKTDKSPCHTYRGVKVYQTRDTETNQLRPQMVLRREGHEDVTIAVNVEKTIAESVYQIQNQVDGLLDQ